MRYAYPCVLVPEESNGFSVSFPDVPEALTCGKDRSEALAMSEDALVAALGAYVRGGQDIPIPSTEAAGQPLVAVRPVVAAKLALYSAMRRQGISKVALAARIGVSEGSVRKLLNPDHRSHIGQVERALQALGRGLVVEDRTA